MRQSCGTPISTQSVCAHRAVFNAKPYLIDVGLIYSYPWYWGSVQRHSSESAHRTEIRPPPPPGAGDSDTESRSQRSVPDRWQIDGDTTGWCQESLTMPKHPRVGRCGACKRSRTVPRSNDQDDASWSRRQRYRVTESKERARSVANRWRYHRVVPGKPQHGYPT